jgi:hypothetical protein
MEAEGENKMTSTTKTVDVRGYLSAPDRDRLYQKPDDALNGKVAFSRNLQSLPALEKAVNYMVDSRKLFVSFVLNEKGKEPEYTTLVSEAESHLSHP